MRRDGVILHRGTEFVPDLFVDCFDDFFAGEHKKTFRCSFTYAGQQNRQSVIEDAKAPRSFPSAGLLFWRLTRSRSFGLTAFPSMSALPRASILLQPPVVLE